MADMSREDHRKALEKYRDGILSGGISVAYDDLLTALDAAITALRGWVRTEDRLPEKMSMLPCSVRVLINTFKGVVTAQYDYEDGVWLDFYIHKRSPFTKPKYYGDQKEVTHWAYLPNPPEVEG